MNLFALTRDSTRPIIKLPLSAELQGEISEVFIKQEATFKEGPKDKIPFDGKYKPDDGECLSITEYDDIDSLHSAIENPLGIPEIKPESSEFENIKALFTGRIDGGKKTALIQAFDRKRVLSTKGTSIFHSGKTYKKIEGIGLTLDTKLAAILEEKELIFFSFFAVRQIFDLTQYYKEATDDDLKVFSSHGNVKIEDFGAFVGVSDAWVRRKVALVMQSGILDNLDFEMAQQAASVFKIQLQTVTEDGVTSIVLPESKAELKKLLRFLDEDYFQSALLSNPHLSNSKRKV